MRDSKRKTHRCLLMRNPWGRTGYNGTWSKTDKKWTNDLIKQVRSIHPNFTNPTDAEK